MYALTWSSALQIQPGHCDTQIPALPLHLSRASFSFLGKEQPSGSMPRGGYVKQEGRAECRQICTRASHKLPMPCHNLADRAVLHLLIPCSAAHCITPKAYQSILKPVLTGQRYFKPRGATPDRLRCVLCVLAEGRGYFTLDTF